MGLIKAGMGALGGTLADQWKEFFYCDSLDKDVLMVKGQKRSSRRSSNHGDDNIITNGSGIAVADGQCMLIVEQGRVVEVCAEPGEFTFDASTEPSVFTGNFGDSLAATFQIVAKRFTHGGDTGKDQRVYYINTKELGEILYGTATPIPFRVVVSEERGYKLSVNPVAAGSRRIYRRQKMRFVLIHIPSFPMAGGAGSSCKQRKTGSSRWGTPCCTYRYRLWL